jgi:hypothetical protein
MWHGIDTDHPLHRLQSAVASAEGVAAVYREVDALVRKLSEELNGVQVLVFAPHGMGPNESDVPSMLLLAELLLRAETGRTLFRSRYDWSSSCDAPLAESENWDRAVLDRLLHDETGFDSGPANDLSAAASNRPRPGPPQVIDEARRARGISVEWMPASQYRRYWPSMRAFALPAYYNGRIRINLKGRESLGIVERHQYDAVCREITALLMECRDLATGEPLVDSVERTATEPLALNDTEADLEVYWRRHSTDMIHPRLGRIGPAPHRRTGGHTGPCGFAYLSGTDIEPGDRGTGSYLDVVPTIFHLLDREVPSGISGNSLIRRV